MISDEELYRRLLAGDEGALEALVHRYHSPLLGFLYRHTGDRHLAEDLVQETFTRLVSYQGDPPRRFRAWAFTIAANLGRSSHRLAYRRYEAPDSLESWGESERSPLLADMGPSADELLLRADNRRVVAEALQSLSPSQREVLILKFYHEMRLEEIAEVTAAPLGTVKSRLFHGLRHMKALLGQEEGAVHEQRAAAQR